MPFSRAPASPSAGAAHCWGQDSPYFFLHWFSSREKLMVMPSRQESDAGFDVAAFQ